KGIIMRKYIIFSLAFLLISSTGFAQKKTVKKEEYNKTKQEEMQEFAQQKAKKMQQGNYVDQEQEYYSARGYNSAASFGFFYIRDTFGMAPVYKQRIDRDVLFVAELGFFNAAKKYYETSAHQSFYNPENMQKSNAVLIPLYAGLRKGFFLEGKMKNYYPYIGAGAGPVLGIGQQRYNYMYSHYTARVTGSAYLIAGTEFYSTKKWFFDVYVRYRHMRFGKMVGEWRNFSGLSIGFAFSRGFGGGYQMLR
ncbi:hypothetical protein ACFL6G_05325, partial [candidate division KSB1 bacterium]